MPLAHLSPTSFQVCSVPQQKQITGKGFPQHSGLGSSSFTRKMRPWCQAGSGQCQSSDCT